MRSPEECDILQIDITSKCHLACSHCTRHVGLLPKHWEMEPETFRTALESLRGWYQPGKVVGLIGGEPTLHSRFEELADIFRENWNEGERHPVGRQPVADYDAFAAERLFDRRSGRGLWTAFGPGFNKNMEAILDTFPHWNPNDHTAGGRHAANLIDRKTLCDALGISDEEWIQYRDNCWVQNQWSATVTPWGAYFCEQAAHHDILFNDGKLAWPIEPGWWQRKPADFGDQLSICESCSLALPAPANLDVANKDIVSEPNRVKLEMVGSPGIRRNRVETFDPAVHLERRLVETKDSYVNGHRVSADNASVRPKRVSAVVVCVGYAEAMRQTLPLNVLQADQVVVVTTAADAETRAVVEGVPGVTVVLSERCYDNGHAFNKGKMINDGLAAVEQADWVVCTDADVTLNPGTRAYLKTHSLHPGCLYGTLRWGSDSPPDMNAEPNGYFQLFNRRARLLRDRWPAVMSEQFCSAGGVDSWFIQQWPAANRVIVPELAVSHVGGGEFGAGWNGQSAGPRWRQFGMLTPDAWIPLPGRELGGTMRLRLTDTLRGRSAVVEADVTDGFPPHVIGLNAQRQIVFCGANVGDHHVHVAAWDEGQ